jgi:hypothetical protein
MYLYMHFDDLPVGAQFVRSFVYPVWTKIEPDGNVDDPVVAEMADQHLLYSDIMHRFDGYVGIITNA